MGINGKRYPINREIETKFKVKSPGEFRKKLKRVKARFICRNLERDIYYGPLGFSVNAEVIRLRRLNGNMGLFTIKSSTDDTASPFFKIRSELEAGTDDAKTFEVILNKLGFQERFRKEKVRETYSLGKIKVLLDKLPYIGWYVELEGPKKYIESAARRLGLDMQNAITDTYMMLFKYYKMVKKKANLELVFK